MSTKKYLSLEEAAAILKIKTDELIRLREKGDVRGFADRGTWKFKAEDVAELHRRRQPDSSPEVPMLDDEEGDDLARQPTVITKGRGSISDSDVRLAPDDQKSAKLPPLTDSDSDVRLAEAPPPTESDVKLVAPTSMTDSDSDVKLASPMTSDSDVRLIEPGSKLKSSDSDVTLLPKSGSKSGKGKGLIDFDASAGGDSESVLMEDMEMPLAADSGIRLGGGSGVSLTAPADSGILLEGGSGFPLMDDSSNTQANEFALDEDSGIKLAGADSGIRLDADSGIKLAAGSGRKLSDNMDDDELESSIPLLLDKADAGRTDVEVPMLEDSGETPTVSLPGDKGKKKTDTSVVMFEEDELGGDLDEEDYGLSDSGADDELEVADDIMGEDDELEQIEVFDSDDSAFDESFVAGGSAVDIPTMGSRLAIPQEPELGAGTFTLLAASSLALCLGAIIGVDLLRTIWGNPGSAVYSGELIGIFAGLFK